MENNLNAVPPEQVFPAHWTHLPHELREHLAKIFEISRSSYTEIVDNKLVSDGRTPRDLANITVEKMQAYLGGSKETNFYHLWDVCISKAKSELNPPKEITAPVDVTPAPVEKPVENVDKPKKSGLEPMPEKQIELANRLMGKTDTVDEKSKGTKAKK